MSESILQNPEDLYSQGNKYRDRQKYKEAIKCFKKAVEINPDYKEAWHTLGRTYGDVGKYDKQIECQKNALNIDPSMNRAWVNMGWAYEQLEDYENWLKCNEKALEIDSTYYAPLYHIGLYYKNKENYPKAIEYFEKSLISHPDYTSTLIHLGTIYVTLKNPKKCLEYLEKSLKLNRTNAWVWSSIAWAYAEEGDYKKTIEHEQKAVRINPNRELSWYRMGWAYHKLKDYKKAAIYYKKTLEINPQHKALANLEYIKDYLERIKVHKKKVRWWKFEKVMESFDESKDFENIWENLKKAWLTDIFIITQIIISLIFLFNSQLWVVSNSSVFEDGEFYRLFTYSFVHGDIIEFILLMVMFLNFGVALETRFQRWQYLLPLIFFIPLGGLLRIMINPFFEYQGPAVITWGFAGMLLYVGIKTNPRLATFLLFLVILPIYNLIFDPSVYISGKIVPILLSDFVILLIGINLGALFYRFNNRK